MSNFKYRVDPNTLDLTIQNIVDKIDNGDKLIKLEKDQLNDDDRLNFNDSIILKPFYQREYRSTTVEESLLVESILLGIPIPPVFLCNNRLKGAQVLDVVDGQHRLYAFYRFRKNKFKLEGLPLLPNLIGKSFNDLEIELKEQFISHKLPGFVFRSFPGKEFELEVFNRYNKGTKALTQQEIRNAVFTSVHNQYINEYIEKLMSNKSDEKYKKISLIYNLTKDRCLKKKVHEGIFTILYVLEYGLDESFKDSTTYAEKYMEKKALLTNSLTEEKLLDDLQSTKYLFSNFNDWLLQFTVITPYPISREIYGISSKSYKFQTSMALILAAIYRKIYIDCLVSFNNFNELSYALRACLVKSFLEDPNYTASTTNSKEIIKLIANFK